jgi:uncharacterized membrane protein YeaQ/YmgE (transglycosylase-associated protein family)
VGSYLAQLGYVRTGLENIMSILIWIIVGLVAGVLASMVMGGTGFGIIGDIIIGIVGAFVGGWLFAKLGVSSPFGGLPGTIFVAFIGAVVLLFVLRLIRGAGR